MRIPAGDTAIFYRGGFLVSQPASENKMGVMPENKLLLNMALPMIVSMLIQACYNIVDSYFVSKLSQDALNAVVLGDERLLTRAVENAISNARLHNEQGCTISVELALRDGAYCTIRVSDDGAGIAAADLAALEARLARSRTARSAAGSFNRDHGLGLVLVDRIARAHEGSLSLDGAPGEGFSVTLALPLA